MNQNNPITLLKTTPGYAEHKIRAWVADTQEKRTQNEKPYRLLVIQDKNFREPLKIWPNYQAINTADALQNGTVIDLTGKFRHGEYGLEADASLSIQIVEKEESQEWLRNQLANEFAEKEMMEIKLMLIGVTDPLLKIVGLIFLEKHEERFMLSGGARFYHHARPGGLVEHSAAMMKSARILAPLYKANVDLVVVGALVHDSGKMKENAYFPGKAEMPFQHEGEMLSHIPNGVLIVEECLQEAKRRLDPDPAVYAATRTHLLHLVASHHGTLEWGSPVTPRTPEALILHTVDNLDAKMEFFRETYATAKTVATDEVTLYEKHFPFPGTIAAPLARVAPEK